MAENNATPTAGGADAEKKSDETVTSTSNTAPSVPPASPAETVHAEAASSTSAAHPTTAERAFQQGLKRENLEQEVGQVLGTLNSWWGGVKKQSASAISSIKADLDKTVSQAQADLEYLRTAKVEVVRKDSAEYEAEQEAERAKKAAKKEEEARSKAKGKEKETDSGDAANPASALLNRLSSSTSQLQHSLQSTLQSTLASASNNPALSNPAALRDQLAENLRLSSARENLQLSMKQAEKLAEEYLRKSDKWMKDAEKWVEDAVKVVPPNEGQIAGTSWDGEWYSFSTSTRSPQSNELLFDAKSERPSLNTLAQAGSRKDALLRRLREDKDLLLVDPEGEDETAERKEEFRAWVKEHWEAEKRACKEEEEGNIGAIRMDLVPEPLSDEQFWQRYLFHKHNIEAEEQKRKQLLQATQQQQEHDDFNWDDEEDPTSPTATSSKPPAQAVASGSATASAAAAVTADSTPKLDSDAKIPSTQQPAVAKAASTATSPRDSEESYDLVSDQGVRAEKPAVVPVPTPTTAAAAPAAAAGAEDSDSDWE